MKYNPLVSIVIPVYDGSNFLARAIDSALAQSYSNFEVLVINDGSNDDGATRDLALSYGKTIRYFEKENGGVATALNAGIEKMRGEYFSWLSHDDEYNYDKLQRQIDFINEYGSDAFFLYSDYELIDEKSEVLEAVRYYDKNVNGLEAIAFGLINGCTALIPRLCFDTVGRFNAELPTTQDYDMWFRLINKYPVKHIPEVLVKCRHHNQQKSKIDNLHKNEGDDFYLGFIKEITIDQKYSNFVDEDFFFKLAAFLKKMQYFHSLDYIKNNYTSKTWLGELRILYYCYVNTTWGNRVGLFTIASDPWRLVNKIFKRAKI